MILLRETDRSVTNICIAVGFTSLGTFSRTFREIVGETPSEYGVGHGADGGAELLSDGDHASRGVGHRRGAIQQFWRSDRARRFVA